MPSGPSATSSTTRGNGSEVITTSQVRASSATEAALTDELDLTPRELVATAVGPAVASAVMLVAMLLFNSAVDPASLSEVAGIAATCAEAFRRTASRLAEMQSDDYLRQGHGISSREADRQGSGGALPAERTASLESESDRGG